MENPSRGEENSRREYAPEIGRWLGGEREEGSK